MKTTHHDYESIKTNIESDIKNLESKKMKIKEEFEEFCIHEEPSYKGGRCKHCLYCDKSLECDRYSFHN